MHKDLLGKIAWSIPGRNGRHDPVIMEPPKVRRTRPDLGTRGPSNQPTQGPNHGGVVVQEWADLMRSVETREAILEEDEAIVPERLSWHTTNISQRATMGYLVTRCPLDESILVG